MLAPRLVAQWYWQGLLFSVSWVRASACMLVILAVSYLSTWLVRCSVDPRISCGARKLARTSRVTKKKKMLAKQDLPILIFEIHVVDEPQN